MNNNSFARNGVRGGAIPLRDNNYSYPSNKGTSVSKGNIMVQTDFGWTRSDESEIEAGYYDDEARIINGLSQNPHAR